MKSLNLQNVHVDSISHNGERAAAGFDLGDHCFHIWFNPATMVATGPLYKNRVEPSNRYRTIRLDPGKKNNRAMLAAMWREIKDRDLVRIAVQNDQIKRAADERSLEAARRKCELCERAQYEIGASIAGKPLSVICDEASARVLLPHFQLAADQSDVYCIDLASGSNVVCFIEPAEVA